MSTEILQTIRDEAKQRGLPWPAVDDAYRLLKDTEAEIRRRPNEIRATAWMMFTASTPSCWPFWRHGFYSRYRHRLARGADYTIIPGYDEIGQQISTVFPEYATDDGTERLFSFLLSPYDRLPTREGLYRKALELAEQWARPSAEPQHEEF